MNSTARYMQFCLAIFVLFFVALYQIYSIPEGGKNEELKIFFTFAALGPPLSVLLWLATISFGPQPFTNTLSLAVASLIASGAIAFMLDGQYPGAMILAATTYMFLFAADWVIRNGRKNLSSSLFKSVVFSNSMMLPLIFLAWSFRNSVTLLYDKIQSSQPWSFHHSSTRCAIGFIAGALLLVIFANHRFPRTSPKWSAPIAVATALIIAALFFDPSFHIIFDAYAPYIGPALRVAHGRTPLIDNVSQYGLNYLLFVPIILAGWPAAALAALVSLLTVLLYFAFLCTAIKLARIKFLAVALGFVFLLFTVACYSYNPVLTPSAMSFRYLPCFLLLLSLSRIPHRRYGTPVSVAALWLSLLWSAEAALFGLAIYGTFVAVIVLGSNLGRRQIAGISMQILVTVSAPYVILFAMYKVTVGDFPHLSPYFEMLTDFARYSNSIWYILVDRSTGIYLLLAAAYACAISLAAFQVWTSRAQDSSGAERAHWAVIAAAGTMGFCLISYYIGRSENPALTFLALPFFLLLILAVDALIVYFRQHGAALAIKAVPEVVFVLLLVPMASGVGYDIFFGPSHPLYGNSTLLREGKSTLDSLPNAWHQSAYSMNEHLLSHDAIDLATLIRRFEPSAPEVLIFAAEAVPALFHTGKIDGFGISNPANDYRSPTLVRAAVRRAAAANAGQIIYVSQTAFLFPIQLEVLEILQSNWLLCPIDQAGDVLAFRLASHNMPCTGLRRMSGR